MFRIASIQCFYTRACFDDDPCINSGASLVVHDGSCNNPPPLLICCHAQSIYVASYNKILLSYLAMDLDCDGTRQAVQVSCSFATFAGS